MVVIFTQHEHDARPEKWWAPVKHLIQQRNRELSMGNGRRGQRMMKNISEVMTRVVHFTVPRAMSRQGQGQELLRVLQRFRVEGF